MEQIAGYPERNMNTEQFLAFILDQLQDALHIGYKPVPMRSYSGSSPRKRFRSSASGRSSHTCKASYRTACSHVNEEGKSLINVI